jgi:hypothetical protein
VLYWIFHSIQLLSVGHNCYVLLLLHIQNRNAKYFTVACVACVNASVKCHLTEHCSSVVNASDCFVWAANFESQLVHCL